MSARIRAKTMVENYQNQKAYIITKVYASGRVTNTIANIVSKDTERGTMCCLYVTDIKEYCKKLYECNKDNTNPNMRLIEVSYKEYSEEV